MNTKIFETLKKTHRMQFFENFEYSDNLLVINILQSKPSFSPSIALKNSLAFKILFRLIARAVNYTLLNTPSGANCLFLRFPLFFSLQRAVFIFSAHSAENCSAQEIKLQCAVEKKTVRWKFENLVLFFRELFA